MYLFNHLKEIYETTKHGSTEYILAQYLLKNINRFDELTITSISLQTAISKSSVSKFITAISLKQTFIQFKTSLLYELEFVKPSKNKIISDYHIFFKRYPEIYKAIDKQQIKRLALAMKQKNKIIFYGDVGKKSFFNSIINYLIFDGKDAKFASWMYISQQKAESLSLDHESIFVLVDPSCTFLEFNLRLSVSMDFSRNLYHHSVEKFFIGRPSRNQSGFKMVNIDCENNNFTDEVLMIGLIAELFYQYLNI